LKKHHRPKAAISHSFFADLANRAIGDMVAGGAVYRNEGLEHLVEAKVSGLSAAAALAEADFDNDGRDDLAAISIDGSLQLLTNKTATANTWLKVKACWE